MLMQKHSEESKEEVLIIGKASILNVCVLCFTSRYRVLMRELLKKAERKKKKKKKKRKQKVFLFGKSQGMTNNLTLSVYVCHGEILNDKIQKGVENRKLLEIGFYVSFHYIV